jgi:hypothetical protein
VHDEGIVLRRVWNCEAIQCLRTRQSLNVGELSWGNMVGVCMAVIELNFLESVTWVVECVGDSKLGSRVDNRECSNQSGLGDVVVSSTQVEVAADGEWSGDDPAPVVGYSQRFEGGVRAAGAGCISIGSATCAR